MKKESEEATGTEAGELPETPEKNDDSCSSEKKRKLQKKKRMQQLRIRQLPTTW